MAEVNYSFRVRNPSDRQIELVSENLASKEFEIRKIENDECIMSFSILVNSSIELAKTVCAAEGSSDIDLFVSILIEEQTNIIDLREDIFLALPHGIKTCISYTEVY